MLEPACLGCLQPLTKMDQATVHFCEKCNLPLCTPNCEFLAQHESQECQIFSEGKLMLGGFQLLDLIITELKSHMTSRSLNSGNSICQKKSFQDLLSSLNAVISTNEST